jgi:hypothetical protein
MWLTLEIDSTPVSRALIGSRQIAKADSNRTHHCHQCKETLVLVEWHASGQGSGYPYIMLIGGDT